MSFYSVQIEGVQSASGAKYVKATSEDETCSTLVPLGMFAGTGQEGLNRLKLNGMPIIGRKDCTAFVDRVSNLDEFEPRNVVEKIGWNGLNMFALPDGHIATHDGAARPDTILPEAAPVIDPTGSLEEWKRTVAGPMEDQKVLQFGIMFLFAPPLLVLTPRHDNYGFELVGPGGRGKSTLQRLMASAAGPGGPGGESDYLVYFDTTMNALEDTMISHSDLPLILEEANLFIQGETARSLATKFMSLAFKLGSGTMKSRWGNPAGAAIRLLYFSSSNEPLASVIGNDTDAAKAAADRLITIPLPSSRPFGVLDSLPKGYDDAASFMNYLLAGASAHQGHAMRAFITSLVEDRATDEIGLRSRIDQWMATFRLRAGINANDGSARRVADAFGLVYAAGELAKSYGVLPGNWHCGLAAMACYRLHLTRRSAGLSFAELIHRLCNDPRVVHLGRGKLPELTNEQFSGGIFKRSGRGGAELLITADRIEDHIPTWPAIRNRAEVRRLLNMEKGRKKVRRTISANRKKLRVFSFKISK